MATTNASVYISVDNGANFNVGPTIALSGGSISSIDLGKYYATGVVNAIVGITGGTAASSVVRFPLAGAYAWLNVGGLKGNVLSARFSPTHSVDAQILAVTGNTTDGKTYLNTQFGTSAWNANMALKELIGEVATGAVIAFGSDYLGTGTNSILVGLMAPTATNNDVFRVSGLTMGAQASAITVKDTGLSGETAGGVTSLALSGTVASGTVLRPFPKSVLEATEKASYEVYEELKAKSKHWARIYPEWKKFRDEQFLWFRAAESTYDNYAFNSRVGAAKPAAKK